MTENCLSAPLNYYSYYYYYVIESRSSADSYRPSGLYEPHSSDDSNLRSQEFAAYNYCNTNSHTSQHSVSNTMPPTQSTLELTKQGGPESDEIPHSSPRINPLSGGQGSETRKIEK